MCTHFKLSVPSQDTPGPHVHVTARCLELSGHMKTAFYRVPRGTAFPLAPPPKPVDPPANGLHWTNTYGFVGVGSQPPGFENFPCFVDGLNEKGLSVGGLWLPGTSFPKPGSEPAVFFADLGGWILGTCASVLELEGKLGGIGVWGPPPPPPPGKQDPQGYLPLHFIATDAEGLSLVLEFIDGETKVYGPAALDGATSDGVLTNAPDYPWQRANLAGYAHLDVTGASTTLTGKGPPVGSGLLGIPGDPMPMSRFVRAATLRKGFHLLPKDGQGWLPAPDGIEGGAGAVQTVVNVALQMVQMIQATPYGTALEKSDGGVKVGDWTMWSLVRDHTNRALYFASGLNGILRWIDLSGDRFGATDGGSGAASLHFIDLQPPPASWAWCEEVTFG